MTSDGLSVEYENGVADVLAFLSTGFAVVERDVAIPGHKSRVSRQIDIAVRGTIYGLTDALLIVDCKRWRHKIDVADAGAFVALVEDVHADIGLLVTSAGHSAAAAQLLRSERGVRLEMVSLDELSRWRPPGTRDVTYRVPSDRTAEASAALRRAGFRVHLTTDPRVADDEIALEAFRHYPAGLEVPPDLFGPMGDALRSIGLEPDVLSHGVVTQGGTPAHRSFEVTVDDRPTGMRVIAADEAELRQQLLAMTEL